MWKLCTLVGLLACCFAQKHEINQGPNVLLQTQSLQLPDRFPILQSAAANVNNGKGVGPSFGGFGGRGGFSGFGESIIVQPSTAILTPPSTSVLTPPSTSTLTPPQALQAVEEEETPSIEGAGVQRGNWGTMAVQGTGMTFINATEAEITIAIDVRTADLTDFSGNPRFSASEVQAEAARRAAEVIGFLRSRNDVSRLRTTSFRLSPIFNFTGSEQVLIGYQVVQQLSFRVPAQNAGVIVDEVVRRGANRVDDINFVASEAAMEAARLNVIDMAAANARARAAAVLNAFDIPTMSTFIRSIRLDQAAPPTPRTEILFATAAAPTPTTFAPGEIQITSFVTIDVLYPLAQAELFQNQS